MSDPGKEQEYREEAERLAQLPRAEQAAIIAWHWDIASDPRLAKRDRQEARTRAEVLERILRRQPSRKGKKA
jgi:hypothetical protein